MCLITTTTNTNICPGCGRCRECGQPAPVVAPVQPLPVPPQQPWPGYPSPYVGDVPGRPQIYC